MNQTYRSVPGKKRTCSWKRASLALMASTLFLSGYSPEVLANPTPLQISQRQQDWNATLQMARLVNVRQETTALVLQMDVLDKPETSYANAVYQIYALQNGRWTQIYTNTGARLISRANGRMALPPEVVLLSDLQRRLGQNVRWSDVELRAVAQIRYDTRSGRSNQQVEWESIQSYSAIAQTTQTSTQTSSQTTAVQTSPSQSSTTQTSQSPLSSLPLPSVGRPNNQLNPHRGHFSLAVLQSQTTLSDVIARVSIKPKRPTNFLQERLIGDFRYRMNQRAQFIRGLNPGDRVIVRLFDTQNRFLGYSEFELLDDNASVNLVLPPNPLESRIVRTVLGVDSQRNGMLDQSFRAYDYFTRVTNVSQSDYRDAQVTFLRNTESLNLSAFNIASLPSPATTCIYPTSFESSAFALVNRTIRAFASNLAPALVATPGQVVQVTNLSSSSTSISTYEVSSQIVTYQEVGLTEGVITTTCDVGCIESNIESNDDDDRAMNRRRNCNQGIGNGPEGCDPGNSRPHGGSNDEGGRVPGQGRGRR